MQKLVTIRTLGFAALAGLALQTSSGEAQDICFSPPQFVPYLPGAPSWAPLDVYKPLNDPRWASSPRRQFANDAQGTTSSEGGYRLVVSGNQLSVSIQNLADTTPNIDDYAAFGLSKPGGQSVAVKIFLNPGGEPNYYFDMLNRPIGEFYTWVNTGGRTWNTKRTGYPDTSMGDPDWLVRGSLANWTTQTVEEGGANWGVQFKVDLSKLGIGPNDDFKIYLGMHDQMRVGSGTTPGAAPDIQTPKKPITGSDADWTFISDTNIWDNPANWAPVSRLSAGCSKGLFIEDSYALGTLNADQSKINKTSGASNTFFANLSGTGDVTGGLHANDLVARFRYANWGAQPSEITSDLNWLPIGGGEAVNNGVSPAPDANSFRFTCPANTATTVCGKPKPTTDNQCMIVEFSPAPGHLSIPVKNGSMFRNMTFENLSSRTLPAQISIKGFRAATGRDMDRDVYLNVVTRNMPELGDIPMFLDSQLLNNLKLAVLGLAQLFNPLGLALTRGDLMKVAWPTYEVHAYYETGRIATNRGKPYKVLAPMNSYGYHFSHSGVFFGYTHGLGGIPKVAGTKGLYMSRLLSEQTLTVTTGVATEDLPRTLVNLVNRGCQLFPFLCGNE